MTLVREIPRDDKNRLWEVWEIKVKLRVEGKGEEGAEHPPVVVEVDTDVELPAALKVEMEKRIMANWLKRLKQRRPGTHNWFLEGVLGYVLTRPMHPPRRCITAPSLPRARAGRSRIARTPLPVVQVGGAELRRAAHGPPAVRQPVPGGHRPAGVALHPCRAAGARKGGGGRDDARASGERAGPPRAGGRAAGGGGGRA